MQTQTQEKSRLDQFAAAPQQVMPSPQSMPAVAMDRAFGAQRVAVYRDETRVMEKLRVLAAMMGDDAYYRFPVKTRGGGTDYIEGISIKGAMAVARHYGNIDVDCRAVDVGDGWLYHARLTDYETGFTLTRPFQQRKSQKTMGNDAERQQDIAFQIGASKAIRNVVANALREFCDFFFEEAKNSIVEKIGRALPQSRSKTAGMLNERNIDVKRAERVVGRALDEWTAPDVAKVVALIKAIADGMTTVADAFPLGDDAKADEKPKDAALNDFAAPAEAPEVQPVETQEPAKPAADGGAASPAYLKGREARRKGASFRAVPGEYRDQPTATDDWRKGWQDEDRAFHEGNA